MSAVTPNVDTGGLILINSYFIQQTFISLHLLCYYSCMDLFLCSSNVIIVFAKMVHFIVVA